MRTPTFTILSLVSLSLVAACAPNEEEIQTEFDAFLANHQQCETARDCAVVSPGCPLGCYRAVASNAAAQARELATNLIADYEKGGQRCDYGCTEPPPLTCQEMRCALCESDSSSADCP